MAVKIHSFIIKMVHVLAVSPPFPPPLHSVFWKLSNDCETNEGAFFWKTWVGEFFFRFVFAIHVFSSQSNIRNVFHWCSACIWRSWHWHGPMHGWMGDGHVVPLSLTYPTDRNVNAIHSFPPIHSCCVHSFMYVLASLAHSTAQQNTTSFVWMPAPWFTLSLCLILRQTTFMYVRQQCQPSFTYIPPSI